MQGADRVSRSRVQVSEIRRVGPARPQPGHRARRDRGHRRPHGERQDDTRLPSAAPLRRRRRPGSSRWGRCARSLSALAALAHRRRLRGPDPLLGVGPRKPGHGASSGFRPRAQARDRRRAGGFRLGASVGARDAGGRAGLHAFRRPAPAAGARAGGAGRPAGVGAGRPSLFGGRSHRGGDRALAVSSARRCDCAPGGAPAVDAGAGRSGRAGRRRHCRSDRHTFGTAQVQRPLSRAAVAGIRTGAKHREGNSMSVLGPADRWRGVASEEVDDFSPSVAGLLRRRSRRLLASLARPYRTELLAAAVLILIRSAAYLALPYLVGLGIDKGIRPGHTGNLTTLAIIVAALLLALMVNSAANYLFLLLSGRLGADILFDLRRTLFAHVQELSLSFYERYTSGRIISRLTSDVDALNELLATGLTSVITSLISVVAITVILL